MAKGKRRVLIEYYERRRTGGNNRQQQQFQWESQWDKVSWKEVEKKIRIALNERFSDSSLIHWPIFCRFQKKKKQKQCTHCLPHFPTQFTFHLLDSINLSSRFCFVAAVVHNSLKAWCAYIFASNNNKNKKQRKVILWIWLNLKTAKLPNCPGSLDYSSAKK